MEEQGIGGEDRTHFLGTLTKVLGQMEPAAIEKIGSIGVKFHWYETPDSLKTAVKQQVETFARRMGKRVRPINPDEIIGGAVFVDHLGEQHLHLDGGKETHGRGRRLSEEYYAHELGHILSGKKGTKRLSDNPQWVEAYNAEMKAGRLGEYAVKSVEEGFAEFHRHLVKATEEGTLGALAEKAPKAYAFFEERGFAKKVEAKVGKVDKSDVFSERIPLDNKGGHADVAKPQDIPFEAQFMAEKESKSQSETLKEEKPSLLKRALAGAAKIGKGVKEFFTKDVPELSHVMGPRTTAIDKETGEALARANTSVEHGRTLGEHAERDLLSHLSPDQQKEGSEKRVMIGGVQVEHRLRAGKEGLRNEAEVQSDKALQLRLEARDETNPKIKARLKERAKKASKLSSAATNQANDVTTTIGEEGSPFKTEVDYQAALKDPDYLKFKEKYLQHVPELEKYYKTAQNIPADKYIEAITQDPNYPVSLKGNQEGEEMKPGMIGNKRRGDPSNTRLRTMSQSRRATLNAERGYDLDVGRQIRNAYGQRVPNAARAELFRTMEKTKVGSWQKPGTKPEEGFSVVKDVHPPRGTQAATQGQTDFHARTEIQGELRRHMNLDEPMRLAGVSDLADIANKANLAGPMDAIYHGANVLTKVITTPGLTAKDFAVNLKNVQQKDGSIDKDWAEIVRIGAGGRGGKEKEGSGLNPMNYPGWGIDVMDKAARLSANKAYDRLAESKLVDPKDETNRRNFINQFGQYNREASHKIVQILKDSGLGPFATAAFRFYSAGLQAITLNPGVKAVSYTAALQLRLKMGMRIGSVALAVAAANFARWGNVKGDDDTPFGAIKVGEKNGKTQYFDALRLTGFTRGLRASGLSAAIQGLKLGQRPGRIADKAYDDIVHSLIHPAIGPAVSAAWTAATGKDFFGKDVTQDLTGSKPLDRILTAAGRTNAVVGEALNFNRPWEERSVTGTAAHLLGPFEFKESSMKTVNEVYDRVHDMEEHRKVAQRKGQIYRDEAQYKRLKSIQTRLSTLGKAVKTAPPEAQGRIRAQMRALAQAGLS